MENRGAIRLALTGLALFVVAGATQAIYGPLFPELRHHFGLLASDAGTLPTLNSLGAFLGICAWTVGEARGAARRLLPASIVLFSLSAFALAAAPDWNLARVAAVVLGTGYGAILLGVNRLFATGSGPRSGAVLNLVNAGFGVGAVAGPLAVGLVPGPARATLYSALGVLALVVLAVLRTPPTPDDDDADPPAGDSDDGDGDGRAGRSRAVLAMLPFLALFFLYVATEAGIGAWMATHLVAHGFSEQAGASWTAAFWGALAVGRLAAVPVSLRLRPRTIVVLSMASALAAVAATTVPGIEPVGYTVAGLSLAAVFPTTFAWLVLWFPRARAAGGLAIAAATLGGTAGPHVVGRVVGRHGVDAVPVTIAVVAAAGLVCAGVLYRLAPRDPPS